MKVPFASHLGTKIMALVLAAFLWGFAYTQNLQKTHIRYRVLFSAPQGLRVDPPGKEIRVAVSGPRRIVERLRSDMVRNLEKKITEDQIKAHEGEDSFSVAVSITQEDVNGDQGLIFPDLPMPITVMLSRVTTREVPVKLVVRGNPAPGYEYVPEYSGVRPTRVNVTGPRSLLTGKDVCIYTKEFDLSGLMSSTFFQPRVAIDPRIEGKPVQVDLSYVAVSVIIRPVHKERTFENVPIKILLDDQEYPYKVATKPAVVTVTVRGPSADVARLTAEDISVFVRVKSTLLPVATAYVEKPDVVVPAPLEAKVDKDNIEVEVSER